MYTHESNHVLWENIEVGRNNTHTWNQLLTLREHVLWENRGFHMIVTSERTFTLREHLFWETILSHDGNHSFWVSKYCEICFIYLRRSLIWDYICFDKTFTLRWYLLKDFIWWENIHFVRSQETKKMNIYFEKTCTVSEQVLW